MNFVKCASILIPILVLMSNGEDYDEHWLPKDTVTVQNQFIKYVNQTDSTYVVNWGNRTVSRFTDPRHFGSFTWIPILKCQNDSFIVLQYGCGSPCWYAMILPMNPIKKVEELPFPMAYDLKRSLVAYIGPGDTIMVVKNIQTGKTDCLVQKGCVSAVSCYCTDSTWIAGNSLFVEFNPTANHGSVKSTPKRQLRLDLERTIVK